MSELILLDFGPLSFQNLPVTCPVVDEQSDVLSDSDDSVRDPDYSPKESSSDDDRESRVDGDESSGASVCVLLTPSLKMMTAYKLLPNNIPKVETRKTLTLFQL